MYVVIYNLSNSLLLALHLRAVLITAAVSPSMAFMSPTALPLCCEKFLTLVAMPALSQKLIEWPKRAKSSAMSGKAG